MPVPELFNQLMDRKEHIKLVVDEYSGTDGLVTMEDIIETLLGLEITDEFDAVEDLQKWARERWEARAKGSDVLDCNATYTVLTRQNMHLIQLITAFMTNRSNYWVNGY